MRSRAACIPLLFLLFSGLFWGCADVVLGADPALVAEIGPRYIFFFIGDGMGPIEVQAGAEALMKASGRELSFLAFPAHGMIRTGNLYGAVTDSAAAGTALASGHKTANGVLNMNPLGSIRYPTIAELAAGRGLKVGIITSVSLNHATPAAYYAAASDRSSYHDIGLQLVDSDFDYFGGGGLLQNADPAGSGKSLLELARARGYLVADTKVKFAALGPGQGKAIAIGEALDSESALPYETERAAGDLRLADFVEKGVSLLSDAPRGFFMMVEGGKIDWAGHANDTPLLLGEVVGLGDAVSAALGFQVAHPGQTLIVVTADHETGGLRYAGTVEKSRDPALLQWTTVGHTGVDVGVYAIGVGAELFSGTYPNTGIFDRLKVLLEASPAP